ncbi:hypothetical protein psyc5s11_13800 [Clostridium gelidum]|uniref:Putative restriction endonuclease domain-containing protein n=1 Tax=Clostridium gelidum TaxID=704125 RepID=A0ABN6IUQ9_9CLOT|nr:Uma2 family endonuclease [Clostridium gelidum]BCZ45313.1 hypothetical protein psyc5s11_13800 [Clostridium gelidum]
MDSSIKEEWIDKEVLMSPRPEHNHMEIQYSIGFKFKEYFDKSCKVAIEESLFLTKDNPIEIKKDLLKLKELISAKKAELVPDIAVYCDKEQVFRRGFLGIPQLVVEILSPNNADDDTEKKKEIYRKYGVSEYWIVSPMSKRVFVYSLENETFKLAGEYNFVKEDIKSNRFESLVININDVELVDDEEF